MDGERMKRMTMKKKKFPETLPVEPPNPDSRDDGMEMWGPDPIITNQKVGRKRLKKKLRNTLVVMFNKNKPSLNERTDGLMYMLRVCSFICITFILLF